MDYITTVANSAQLELRDDEKNDTSEVKEQFLTLNIELLENVPIGLVPQNPSVHEHLQKQMHQWTSERFGEPWIILHQNVLNGLMETKQGQTKKRCISQPGSLIPYY